MLPGKNTKTCWAASIGLWIHTGSY